MKYRESDESPGTGVYEISIRIHSSLEFIIGRALGCLRAYNIKKKKKNSAKYFKGASVAKTSSSRPSSDRSGRAEYRQRSRCTHAAAILTEKQSLILFIFFCPALVGRRRFKNCCKQL